MQKETSPQSRDEILRELLKNEFQKRAERNPSFSLRAFSQKIGVDQSLLSKLLQGKRKFSEDSAIKISEFLGVYLNKLQNSKPSIGMKSNYDFIEEDQFFVLAGWYHFAILELIKIKGFKNDSEFVSKKLGISPQETQRALERLERLGYIEIGKTKDKKISLKKPSNTWVNLEKTNAARKKMQKELQQKSLEALEDIPFEQREHSSLTVSVDPALIPEIKKKITEFRRSLDKFIEENGKQKEVYNLCVSFFPLTKTNKKKD